MNSKVVSNFYYLLQVSQSLRVEDHSQEGFNFGNVSTLDKLTLGGRLRRRDSTHIFSSPMGFLSYVF